MTTTTITAPHKSRSLSALLHDAFHVRGLAVSDAPQAANPPRPRREPRNADQTTMLVTFAGRYGARF